MIETQGLAAFILCLVLLAAVVAIAAHEIHHFTEPEPRTPRPDPEEPIDFTEAIKSCGGLPPWEDNRR